jgi:ApaG protein
VSRLPVRAVYEARTREILVRVQPAYMPAQSDPAKNQYTFSYTVEIENHGSDTVQLISRHWIITDGHGRVEEVEGPGVVGEQPTLKPREAFRYSSGCPLTTPTGEMRGTYRFVTEGDEVFDAEIPVFSLHTPDAVKRMN